MKICYFGDYDPGYARNRVLLKGLRENGAEIIECNARENGWQKYLRLIKLHKKIKNSYDLMIVGYSDDRLMMPLAWLLTRKKIVWDAFYSLYDSWVFDKKIIKPYSLKAFYYWFLDWLGCKLATKILLDTDEHIKYFVRKFNINKSKFLKVLVGTDDSVFKKCSEKPNKDKFVIHFHGKFIPLQGVYIIIRSAALLENESVFFQIIGAGQEYEKCRELSRELNLKSIDWIDKVGYDDLFFYINKADVCLGIFGDTEKTLRVIPNKVYECIAMAKPVITADTPAARELFTDRQNILFCRAADAEDLAMKILELKNNLKLRQAIARGGYELLKAKATPEIIGKDLLAALEKL